MESVATYGRVRRGSGGWEEGAAAKAAAFERVGERGVPGARPSRCVCFVSRLCCFVALAFEDHEHIIRIIRDIQCTAGESSQKS